MEGSTGSDSISKPWDHAWSTEEMRKHRTEWSLAGDSGLLKHLQQFSENLTKKANETQEAIDCMNSQLNETAILVDNITNTSLALANTQFIESRVQEDNIETEQLAEDLKKNEIDHELSATDLLVSVCESIKQGLKIMDEKYEKVEVLASDSEDEDDNTVPSVILRPKDPYQDRPLPYVIGTEQWKSSSKVGLESSSSESEQNEDEEESASDTDDKHVGSILHTNPRMNLGIGRLSSTSSESNDYNVESSSIKDTDHSRLHARSQDTLNLDTEPTTPSSILPKTQYVNNGPPTFAEELAKRLGSVLPVQKTVVQDSSEQIVNRSKEDIFSQEDDQDVFSSTKSDNLFSKGTNLFSDEASSTTWKDKPVRPINKNIIPPSMDGPPPLTIISSAPKSTIDDLFGEADESDDSDDIFSKKAPKDIFVPQREAVRAEIASKQKHLNVENVQNTSTITTSTPETYDKAKNLFDDDDDDDLFATAAKVTKPVQETPPVGPVKKKPVGGVSILGNVDILSSSKFTRRPPSSSSSESESTDQRIGSMNSSGNNTGRVASRSNNSIGNNAAFSSLEAGNNANSPAVTISSGAGSSSSSGISVQQRSIDNTAGSSLGADFQPLMSSSRLKSEEIYRERVASDSLFAASGRGNDTGDQQQRETTQQQQQQDDVSEQEDVFGPPPLPRVKSKVASLFDDSDSGDDLFASASPSSLVSSERTPSRVSLPTAQKQKTRSLFDDDVDDLFSARDAPDVDLFAATPVRSISRVATGLFDDEASLFDEKKPASKVDLFGAEAAAVATAKAEREPDVAKKREEASEESVFKKPAIPEKKLPDLFAEPPPLADASERSASGDRVFDAAKSSESGKNVAKEPAAKVVQVEKVDETPKIASAELFDDSDLFAKPAAAPIAEKPAAKSKSSLSSSIFEDASDSDLFGGSSTSRSKPNAIGSKSSDDSLFDDSKDPGGLFGARDARVSVARKQSPTGLFDDKPSAKARKLAGSIFDDDDDDEDDLFGGSSFAKRSAGSIFGEDSDSGNAERKMEESEEIRAKVVEKSGIFDDDDDDDGDLFGDKTKKKTVIRRQPAADREKSDDDLFSGGAKDKISAKTKEDVAKSEDKQEKGESNGKREAAPTKPEVAPKKAAILADLKQKLEKHRAEAVDKQPVDSSRHVVDGTSSSRMEQPPAAKAKIEPPRTLKIKATTPPEPPKESPTSPQQLPKKPVVSGKIKNLMGKMGDLKIMSPTDTPPVFRKNAEERADNEEEPEAASSAAGELGSSEASTPTMPSGGSSPRTSGTNSRARDSPSIKSDNTEAAISFDEPAQVDTLASNASKSRARIPAKRRPQSRQARQSALRHSGIDFDAVDASATSPTSDQLNGDANDAVDRLVPHRTHESGHGDDKSELSASRNTTTNLLSPSTDEEDLFDVPPDLPEDPAAKEDSLFGRAPILSPIEPVDRKEETVKAQKKKEDSVRKETEANSKVEESSKTEEVVEEKKEEKANKAVDPLRDENHDPLKDPSQLFAFVTKTPSPEKNKGLLLNEDDDSLFSSSSKSSEKTVETKPKPKLDLFVDDDDSSSDLFSNSKTKLTKKPLKDMKIGLFDDIPPDDDDHSLFGSSIKKSDEVKKEKPAPAPSASAKVVEKPEPATTKTAAKDIFNNSSDEDDIFASSKKVRPKKKTTSLFDDDDCDEDDGDIFAKPKLTTSKDSKSTADSDRPAVKKAITRDLTKTAEKIVKDPLSLLQDD